MSFLSNCSFCNVSYKDRWLIIGPEVSICELCARYAVSYADKRNKDLGISICLQCLEVMAVACPCGYCDVIAYVQSCPYCHKEKTQDIAVCKNYIEQQTIGE